MHQRSIKYKFASNRFSWGYRKDWKRLRKKKICFCNIISPSIIPCCDAGGLRAVLPMYRAHICLCTFTIAIYSLPQKGLPLESYRALSPTGFYSGLFYQRVLPCLTTGSKIQAFFILVCFALLGFIDTAFLFFLQIKGLQQPCVRQVSLSAPFSQQHMLTSCLCITFC